MSVAKVTELPGPGSKAWKSLSATAKLTRTGSTWKSLLFWKT